MGAFQPKLMEMCIIQKLDMIILMSPFQLRITYDLTVFCEGGLLCLLERYSTYGSTSAESLAAPVMLIWAMLHALEVHILLYRPRTMLHGAHLPAPPTPTHTHFESSYQCLESTSSWRERKTPVRNTLRKSQHQVQLVILAIGTPCKCYC